MEDVLLSVLKNHVVQIALLAGFFTGLVAALRAAGSAKPDSTAATGIINTDGTINRRTRKRGLVGWLYWGKVQYMQVWCLAAILYLLPPSEFVGELPVLVSPFFTALTITAFSLAIHSAAKNAGQSDPVQWMAGKVSTRAEEWLKKL